MLPVVILCGGLGTRLRPVTEDLPKPLVPVAGKPFLAYLLDQLEKEGATEVILSTGYLSEKIESFANTNSWDLSIRCIEENRRLGTGGALRFVAEKAGLSTFIAMNGDTYFGGSVQRLASFHGDKPEAAASIALTRTDQPERYVQVEFDFETGRIYEFNEKGACENDTVWINAGSYVLESELWTSIDRDEKVSLEHDVLQENLEMGIYGLPFSGSEFIDIGIPEDLQRAEGRLS